MTRRMMPKPTKSVIKIVSTINAKSPGTGKGRIVVLLSILMLSGLVISVIYFIHTPSVIVIARAPLTAKPKLVTPAAAMEYVGASSCKQCHQAEVEAWQGSHHNLTMQEANTQTVLGDFNNTIFKHGDVESTFFKRDDKFMVRTDGPDGKLTDYPITYTFGVTPLQQYLIAFPGGRYQALSIAWDSRPKIEGGQHWFHLYATEKVDYTDQLHWTGRYQNWNMECAECHSTHLKKGYDAATNSYKTTFNEINVACESCHGPASQHIKWAKQAQPRYSDANKGFAIKLNSDWQKAWAFSGNSVIAHREQPANDALMNVCWTCHSRRLALVEGSLPGLPLENTHQPALLT
ncbi:MAG: hypothetical protein RLZZ419_1970 [Pseudomonadota bacterium]